MKFTKTALILGAAGALVLGLSGFSYDYSDSGTYGPPGSQMVLGSDPVSVWQQGLTCDVTIDLGNNDSVRPGSDILVSTGDESHLFADTEAVKGDPGPVTFHWKLGTDITATLTFGPNHEYDGDGYDNAAFSGFGTVSIGDCDMPPVEPPHVQVCPPFCAPVDVGTPAKVDAATPVAATPGFTG